MRRFLYFFPGVPGINPRMLADRGALDRFTARIGGGGDLLEHVIMAVPNGPGGSGCIVAAGPRTPAYDPANQRWIQGEKFWVGIEDAAPRPDDLVRDLCVSGEELQLADGLVWNVPVIHRWDEKNLQHVPNLPQVLAPVTRDGRLEVGVQVRPEYTGVDAIARRMFAAFAAEKALPLEELLADAAAILAVNYRVGVEEVGLLGLLDAQTAVTVLGLSIDMPSLRAQAKQLETMGLEYVAPEIEGE